MADVVGEEVDEVDTIVGISLNGILFANSIISFSFLHIAMKPFFDILSLIIELLSVPVINFSIDF